MSKLVNLSVSILLFVQINFQDEHFHLYDVKNRETLETLDLSIVQVGNGDKYHHAITQIMGNYDYRELQVS